MEERDAAPAALVEGPAARCTALAVEYRPASGTVLALDGIDASFERGRLTVISGPSGSGKSSLLRALAGLQQPCAGRIEIDGHDISHWRARRRRWLRRRSVAVVLQDPADNLVDYLDARAQVELSARLRGVSGAEAAELLDRVGLAGRHRCLPAELSGGEQQRVAFAAGAIGRPALLLADEPTSELDAEAGAALVVVLRTLADQGTAVVVASHDAAVVAAADVVVRLRDGRVVA